jgi:large subunit ribosomal protein L3
MIDTILASKGEMSAAFVKGRRVAVTKVVAGPCVVTQVKNMEKDGYWAVQLGFGEKKIKNITKPMQGHLEKSSKAPKTSKKQNSLPRFIKEVRLDKEPDLNVGDRINASDIFSAGDIVEVSGVSKGKGFQGVVKRWGFAGGPRTHGQSDRERAPGSIGQGTTPGRVYKGKHMAGRMGGGSVTIKNLQVVEVEPETGLVEISGPVPGAVGSLLKITRLKKGELTGIQEIQAQVVEGEEPAGEAPVEGQTPVAQEDPTTAEVKKEVIDKGGQSEQG